MHEERMHMRVQHVLVSCPSAVRSGSCGHQVDELLVVELRNLFDGDIHVPQAQTERMCAPFGFASVIQKVRQLLVRWRDHYF